MMRMKDAIIRYLMETYRPQAVVLYGSYADGSANENSDFDALVISDHEKCHDGSLIENTLLDVFVYPPDYFRSDFDPEEFVQITEGNILLDQYGTAARLQRHVREHISNLPQKTDEELIQEIGWCEKMAARTLRGDAEGYYRWHWVLTDSLEIYCDLKRLYYYGPKKTLRQMERNDIPAFQLCALALRTMERKALFDWILFLKTLAPHGENAEK